MSPTHATEATTPAAADRPLRLLAVDDERPALDELVYLLRRHPAVGSVEGASDATTALRILRDAPVDGVFLDIDMPGLDGMELAGVLSNFASPPAVVFVTAHDDRAVAAFEIGAVDYLLKPIRDQRLSDAVRRVVDKRSGAVPGPAGRSDQDDVIPVELGGVTTMVPRSTVVWVEAEGDYARLHTTTGTHLVRIALSTLESRWADHGFLRVHRSYLVSVGQVGGTRTVGSGLVVCLRGTGACPPVELPVSRRHTRELRDRLVRGPRAALAGQHRS
ncbi:MULTISPECIES: LytR/AlgR family response regulator transcription factor [unclassified Rhodococcus (in: high G+C Gram-positive bacteria)]|jgi:DNA-binding LytR/AlgR family response regulator|uniref:LytR/AlgR family response regulator transcription factor n=1 Tax=unclassified Rhodococcus (in: high G+C Gram-positive bacteria) TaxID=192944 RepID=UPI00068988AC|nr:MULTISPECIES: LytTR family DNA-binding domain-containing protein [unclassified Rhodococcus (in: high G+C Gram-positive bacteria)]KQU39311.1 LytR family transcriptional regulator [Rhodococcus sp. Leaf225]KQU43747.1 LytR family transcriptional regulator [Rhodococcus sp. Leaf258]MBY6679206.1 response regulator transcription factor [Rhodococcus sp. BP-332]MBY6683251.1 response regulator transcription factor [Rhodococcus sp. BP-316]MDQ1181381.1 two-component system response regulator LytT [Rhodo